MVHNLKDYKSYPNFHRWQVNRNKINIFSNRVINLEDTLMLNGIYHTVKALEQRPEHPSTLYVESIEYPYITESTTYYELLIG